MSFATSNHRHLLSGLTKTGGWFVISRAVQLATGVWVTRQLDPKDFTVLAVVFAIQGFAQQATALNLGSELVRAREIDKADLDVAWSYEFIRNVILWSIISALAPWLAAWTKYPEVTGAIRLSACGMLIGSFRNPRLVELRRQRLFGRLGWLESAPMLAYAAFAVLFVGMKPDYYSLIYTGLASAFVGVIISYHRLPWRPALNFDFQRVRPMLTFGLVLLLASGFFALQENGIVFIVSARGFESDLGYLNRAIAFSMALAFQAVGVFWKVAYPHYAVVKLEGGDVVREAIVASRWLLLSCLPVALLVGSFSGTIINLVLGEKWSPVAPLWSWLLAAGALRLANAPLEACLQAIRRERIQTLIFAASTSLYLVMAWLLLPTHGITAVGMAACASTVLNTILLSVILRKSKEPPDGRTLSPERVSNVTQ